jgi:hypothetical protein
MKKTGGYRIVGRITRSRHEERIGRWVVVNQDDVACSYHATWGEAERVRQAKNREARKERRAA